MILKKEKLESGQSLFEVVLSLAVITIIIVALVILVSNSIRNATYSRNKSLATKYSQEITEWLRGERDTDWNSFAQKASAPQYCFSSLSWKVGGCGDDDKISGTPLKREVLFETSPNNIKATIVVYWEDSQGIHEVRVVTHYTDWRAL